MSALAVLLAASLAQGGQASRTIPATRDASLPLCAGPALFPRPKKLSRVEHWSLDSLQQLEEQLGALASDGAKLRWREAKEPLPDPGLWGYLGEWLGQRGEGKLAADLKKAGAEAFWNGADERRRAGILKRALTAYALDSLRMNQLVSVYLETRKSACERAKPWSEEQHLSVLQGARRFLTALKSLGGRLPKDLDQAPDLERVASDWGAVVEPALRARLLAYSREAAGLPIQLAASMERSVAEMSRARARGYTAPKTP